VKYVANVSLDGRMFAINKQTGEVVWERKVADPALGETLTIAPLINMTNDDGRKPEGAPERCPKAGVGAPSGVDGRLSMGTWVHFSRSLPSNSWWQTMAGWQVLSRPSAAEGGGRRPAFTGLATRPYSATEVDGWQHKLSRVSQNRAAVHGCLGRRRPIAAAG
jgi:PQQ enzyme repeat